MARLIQLVAINFALLSSLLVILFIIVPVVAELFDGAPDEPARQTKLPNYSQSAWAVDHFREFKQLRTEYHSFVGWRRAPFAGKTIVVEGPFRERRTPLPPGAAQPSVFFFGGSTMWGTGSRDQDTIPALYAAATKRIARNFGESAYIAHQNLEMLLWLLQSGLKPTAVVFYDGVNDVLQKCVSGHDLFAHVQQGRISRRLDLEMGSLRYFTAPLLDLLPRESEDAGDEYNHDKDYNCDDDPAKAAAVAQSLLSDWETARAVAGLHQIRFYAALQPVVYFSKTRRDRLVSNARDKERQLQYEAVYPLIRAELGARGFFDLTAVLDRDEYIYIDFCHLSPNGNALVVEALTRLVK